MLKCIFYLREHKSKMEQNPTLNDLNMGGDLHNKENQPSFFLNLDDVVLGNGFQNIESQSIPFNTDLFNIINENENITPNVSLMDYM